MSNDMSDIRQETMPTAFEQLEVRRALGKSSLPVPDVDAEWEAFCANMQESPKSSYSSFSHLSSITAKISLRKLFLAAAVALLIGLTPLLFSSKEVEVFTANDEVKEIVITSEDGVKTIVPRDKVLAYDQPATQKATVTGERKPRMLELSVPRGENGQVTLADGTRVWLNADSKITFPDKFVGKERQVKVSGEVYFEVTKDARHPFVVVTDYFSTTVHGTSFNIRAYSEEDASITLVNGKVSVAPANGASTTLAPGQMARCNGAGSLFVDAVDVYPLTQWKNGYFYFNDTPLLDIMMALGRWYNVSVVFEREDDMQRRLHFVAEHQESLQNIIKRLNELSDVRIKMERDHVSVE